MTTNQDVIKPFSTFSDKSTSLKEKSHICNLSVLHDLASRWFLDRNISANRNNNYQTQFVTPRSPSDTMLYKNTPQLNSVFTSELNMHDNLVRKLSTSNNVTVDKNDNPLDYSMHSHFNTSHYLTSTNPKASIPQQSKYNHNSLEFLNNCNSHNNITSSFSKSECTLEPVVSYATNNGTNSVRILKRKYSKSHSNVAKRYTEKYIRTGINKIDGMNQPSVIDIATVSNNKTLDAIYSKSEDCLLTQNLLKDTYSLNQKTINEEPNSISGKKLKINENCLKCDKSTINKQTIDPDCYSISTSNTRNRDDNKLATNNACNNNDTKNSIVSTGAYKYLSWREKDRRRRFREEWKHLWLVVPHGFHEVMCLVCHKVMTQRKLDTIKRHVVRRHPDLLKMPEGDRQELFDQLIKRHNLIGDTNTGSVTSSPRKLSQKSSDLSKSNYSKNLHSFPNTHMTKESSPKFVINTPTWSTYHISDRNILKNVNRLNNIPLFDTPTSQSELYKKSRDSLTELHQVLNINPTLKQCLTSTGSEYLSKLNKEVINTRTPNYVPAKLPKGWSDFSKVTRSPVPIFVSSPSGLVDLLDYSTTSNRYYPTEINQQSLLPSNPQILSPMFSQKPLFSSENEISTFDSFRQFCSFNSSNINVNSVNSLGSFTNKLSEPSNSLLLSPMVQPECSSNIRISVKSPGYMKSTSTVHSNGITTDDKSLYIISDNINCIGQNDRVNGDINVYDNSPTNKTYSDSQLYSVKDHIVHDYNTSEPNQYIRLSKNASTSCASNTSSDFDSLVSKISGLEESQYFMIAAWYAALMNSTKSTNQVSDITSSNLYKVMWNESVGTEQPCELPVQSPDPEVFDAYLRVSSNSDQNVSFRLKQEKLSDSSGFTNTEQSHKHEVSLCLSKQTSPSCQLKVNSDLNKFTISSLLSTEHRETPTTLSTTTLKTIDQCNNIANSSSKLTDPEECSKFKSFSEYVSCILYRIHEKNMENSFQVRDQIKFDIPNFEFLSQIFSKEVNAHHRKTTAFTSPTKLSDSFHSSTETIPKTNTPNQIYSDVCISQNHIPSVHFLDSNNRFTNQMETYIKCYYDEQLRHHFDHIQKENQSNEQVTTSYYVP
ncbi:asparagine rich [Schistosoma japonicum]|nr:asparagine rich [Schistosoma japonicum]KAH8859605.1 asparagine rich [Schistosoma japonicum]